MKLGRRFRRREEDLDAGLVFGWRVPGGSLGRMVVGVLVATVLFAGGATLLRVQIPMSAMPAREAAQVIVVRESDAESRELLDWARFNSPFPDRWAPQGTGLLEGVMAQVNSDLAASCAYVPHLMPLLDASVSRPLPGLVELEGFPLPPVEVDFKRPMQGMVVAKVEAVSEARGGLQERWGTEKIAWGGPDPASLVGSEVSYTVGLTPEGRVGFCLELAGGGEGIEDEVSDAIEAWLRGLHLKTDPEALGMASGVVVVRFDAIPAKPVAPAPAPEEAK